MDVDRQIFSQMEFPRKVLGISSLIHLRPDGSPFGSKTFALREVFASCGDKNDGHFSGGSVIYVDDTLPLLSLLLLHHIKWLDKMLMFEIKSCSN